MPSLDGHNARNVVQTNVEEEAYVGEETDNEGNIDEDEDQEDVEEGSEDEENMNDSIALVNSAKSQPLMGRSGKHPVSAFHDISVLRQTRADDCFFGSKRHFESPLAKGRIFYSKQHLQFAVNEFHISNNMEVRVSTSNKSRLDFKCKDSTCKWKLYAKTTKIGSSWKIQTCQFPHTCRAPADRFDHAQLTAAVIADVIRDDLKENLELSILSIRQLVRQRYKNVKPKYNKLWRGRELAIVQLFGSWEESYALVTPLLEAMKASNPGTKYQLLSNPTSPEGHQSFKCLAWAFGPCIESVPYLRPVISVDASFLSGRYRGRLLIACGYDAENRLLPLAFAIVEKEDSDNWGWFMRWLRKEVIGFGNFMCVVLIVTRL
ncbi:Os07g0661150 [Oryza sativa Japonica Group]|uniref:Os07g0661150 protein n=1 Tax=Oryza sativa subsp. japonica TaxID=39947 RepID=A0A0P0XA09_ORYSJ|nr:Os07g0661150 [Oryza sativa Japonica Group]